ncbi:MAG: acyl-CoA dehydrogenase family protein [Sphingorhabdus sp.]
MIDLSQSEFADSVADAVVRLCEGVSGNPQQFWVELCAFGLFDLGADVESGGLEALTMAFKVLGAYGAPGPLAETILAARTVPDELRPALAAGASVARKGGTGFDYGRDGLLHFVVEGNELLQCQPPDRDSNGWYQANAATLPTGFSLRVSACTAYRLTNAAYLVGGAGRLLEIAADHVRTRRQFRKALAEFQAVTHPLADVFVKLTAARNLIAAAASAFDLGDEVRGGHLSHFALASARNAAALASNVAHQAHGASGVIVEGPVVALSLQLRHVQNMSVLADALPGNPLAIKDWPKHVPGLLSVPAGIMNEVRS